MEAVRSTKTFQCTTSFAKKVNTTLDHIVFLPSPHHASKRLKCILYTCESRCCQLGYIEVPDLDDVVVGGTSDLGAVDVDTVDLSVMTTERMKTLLPVDQRHNVINNCQYFTYIYLNEFSLTFILQFVDYY